MSSLFPFRIDASSILCNMNLSCREILVFLWKTMQKGCSPHWAYPLPPSRTSCPEQLAEPVLCTPEHKHGSFPPLAASNRSLDSLVSCSGLSLGPTDAASLQFSRALSQHCFLLTVSLPRFFHDAHLSIIHNLGPSS